MADLYKKCITHDDKLKIVNRALELRKSYKLSSTVIATRLNLAGSSHLRKIMMDHGLWEEFLSHGSNN